MNVMRYLLHFITVFTTTTSDHKLFRKILAMAGGKSFPRSKNSNGRKSLHRAHSIWGHRESQAIYGGFR